MLMFTQAVVSSKVALATVTGLHKNAKVVTTEFFHNVLGLQVLAIVEQLAGASAISTLHKQILV